MFGAELALDHVGTRGIGILDAVVTLLLLFIRFANTKLAASPAATSDMAADPYRVFSDLDPRPDLIPLAIAS